MRRDLPFLIWCRTHKLKERLSSLSFCVLKGVQSLVVHPFLDFEPKGKPHIFLVAIALALFTEVNRSAQVFHRVDDVVDVAFRYVQSLR